jgi:hypothetical protein
VILHRLHTSEEIDSIISVEIPDLAEVPELYELVVRRVTPVIHNLCRAHGRSKVCNENHNIIIAILIVIIITLDARLPSSLLVSFPLSLLFLIQLSLLIFLLDLSPPDRMLLRTRRDLRF